MKHAILEGEKAVRKYQRNYKQLKEQRMIANDGKPGVWPGNKNKKNKKSKSSKSSQNIKSDDDDQE